MKMSEDKQIVLMFKGLIAGLPADAQQKVKEYDTKMRAMIAEDEMAAVALGLIGAELAAED